MIIDLLAWSGALLSCLLSIPQLLQALHSERLEGLSAATYWLVLGNAGVWAAWAVLAGEYAAGVPALINGPAAVVIIVRIHAVQTARSDRAEDPGLAKGAAAGDRCVPGRQDPPVGLGGERLDVAQVL